ncbi:MAG: hypothetical protein KJZ84_03005 [Bryobacteraceae bacterium]|nr:hypothetical protein [Bryobacteraceae bacterium]
MIKPTREGFARFAGKWGHLVGRTFNFAGDLITGDSLETWTDAHKVIAHLFRLLSAIRSRDGLRRFLKPGKGGQYQYSFGRSGTWITAASDVEAGWRALQWTLNSHLQDAVVKRLLWDAELQRLSLHDVPRHLWGHMLYQFARAVDGEKQYRQCAECSRWFEVGAPGASRRDRIYCSGACRARVFRRNKEA